METEKKREYSKVSHSGESSPSTCIHRHSMGEQGTAPERAEGNATCITISITDGDLQQAIQPILQSPEQNRKEWKIFLPPS